MNEINIRFASKAEAQELIPGNTQYYNRLKQMDIDWRARKENATLDELIAFAQSQVQDFTPRNINILKDSIVRIKHLLDKRGCQLPIPEEIIFVKTDMMDEGGATGYTTRNQIFLNSYMLDRPSRGLDILIAHELFHCITRHSPEFRKKMYALIGFTVMDHDIEFPEGIGYRIMANPDVDHIDSYAEFDIDGKKRKCALVPFYRMSWDEACDEDGEEASFFNHIAEVLIPLDDFSGFFDISEASDFWDKMGGNTDYVNSPEECLAVNFSYAIIFGLDGGYYTPQLIKSMLEILKNPI